MNERRNINAAIESIEKLRDSRYAVEETVVDEGPSEAYGVVQDEVEVEERAVENSSYNNRDLTIKHLHHGYIVEVDCHRFAFETVDRMLKYVGEYLKDPSATEKKWWNKELF